MEQRELNDAEFKGYVKAKLEDIGEKQEKMDKKLDVLDTCINRMNVKVAAIGGTVSLVVTIVILLVTKHL